MALQQTLARELREIAAEIEQAAEITFASTSRDVGYVYKLDKNGDLVDATDNGEREIRIEIKWQNAP